MRPHLNLTRANISDALEIFERESNMQRKDNVIDGPANKVDDDKVLVVDAMYLAFSRVSCVGFMKYAFHVYSQSSIKPCIIFSVVIFCFCAIMTPIVRLQMKDDLVQVLINENRDHEIGNISLLMGSNADRRHDIADIIAIIGGDSYRYPRVQNRLEVMRQFNIQNRGGNEQEIFSKYFVVSQEVIELR